MVPIRSVALPPAAFQGDRRGLPANVIPMRRAPGSLPGGSALPPPKPAV